MPLFNSISKSKALAKPVPTTPAVPSSTSATITTPTKITPPQTKSNLPPAAKDYILDLSKPSPNGVFGNTPPPASAPTTQPSPTPTQPTTPTGPSATDMAFSEYIKSLQPNTDVNNAKTAYNDYVANAKLGSANLEGQGRGIPLTIVKGQQQKLMDQAQPEADRLQNNIGIAKDSATAIATANKAKYDYEVGKTTTAKSAITDTKPFDVGDHTYVFNPTTQRYEDQGINTKDTTTGTGAGFTLSPGENRYDANGKLIASGGAKPMTQVQETASIAKQEKEVASQQSASQSIGIVNSLLGGDRYKSISGLLQGGSVPFFGDRAAKNEYDQLQGLLKLGARSLLKGQGAVSDYEGKILGDATSSLDRGASESQFKEALQKVRGVLKTNNGQVTSVEVTNPETGEKVTADLSGSEIYHLVSEGNTIKYK